MKKSNIKHFMGGWFVGDFEPSIFKNPFFEVGHHSHKKNDQTFPHYHQVTNELNYIVRGEMMVDKQHLKAGDMWIYEPWDISDVEFLEDTDLMIIRWPSIPTDKYPI
tara:strand:+ start:198 stop:518 length:321 start_codon:yes stop_codon:yes gene_type:complete